MNDAWDHSEDDIALVGEYVLGLLPEAERRALESRLLAEPGLRLLVAEWDEALAPLTDDIAAVPPPAALRRRIERAVFTAPRRSRTWGGGSWLGLGAMTGALVAALAVVAFLAVEPFGPPQPTHRAEIAANDRSLRFAAALNAETGNVELTRLEGAARPGRALELWLIAEGADAPVSLGLLGEEGRTVLNLTPDQIDDLGGAVLAISDEPPGGSPTGLPTGDVLATGEVSPAAS